MLAIFDFLRQFSPQLLVGVGIALLVVPKWIRMILAFGLIYVGLVQMGILPDTFELMGPSGTLQAGISKEGNL